MSNKVDVIINVYGKPYQTIVTLKSLLLHSKQHIDTIFIIEESNQPFYLDINMILNEFENIIHFRPKIFNFIKKHKENKFSNQKYRNSLRYQYGIENSEKKHVFITHNDVLYHNDIIGLLLSEIGSNVGIGEIGQCWNCPLNKAQLCDGERFNTFNYNIIEIEKAYKAFPPERKLPINTELPFPLPECRLNEWFCLINNEINKSETARNKHIPPFGTHINVTDTAVEWFRQMFLKGYTFKNINLEKYATHAYFSLNGNGHSSLFDITKYNQEELKAKQYLEANYNIFTSPKISFLYRILNYFNIKNH